MIICFWFTNLGLASTSVQFSHRASNIASVSKQTLFSQTFASSISFSVREFTHTSYNHHRHCKENFLSLHFINIYCLLKYHAKEHCQKSSGHTHLWRIDLLQWIVKKWFQCFPSQEVFCFFSQGFYQIEFLLIST